MTELSALVLLLGLVAAPSQTNAPAAAPPKPPTPATEKPDPHCGFGAFGSPYYPPIAPYAVPTCPGHYVGYYVGGGCALGGYDREPLQGTWGWDYEGHGWFYRNVFLKWCNRYQGGVGAYTNEYPHVPNVFGIKLHHKDGCEPPP